MKKIGLGIVGLGYIGNLHLRHSLKVPDARLVAVADMSKKALARARETGVKKLFTNYEDLLKDPEVDAVVIALPTHLHLDCALRAAEAGKHVLLEKPIAKNLEEAKQIVIAARRNSIKLMIGYPLRFNSLFRDIKEKIQSGTLGDVEVAYSTFISSGPFLHRAEGHTPIPVPEWWFHAESTGGGALIDLGSHLINLTRWYFGEVTDIKSHLRHRFNLESEDGAVCLAKFKSGALAVINVGWFSQSYKLAIEVFGSVSNAYAEHTSSNPIMTVAQALTTGTTKLHWPHLAELQHFVHCLSNDLNPSPSGEEGLKDLQAITQAYKNQFSLI